MGRVIAASLLVVAACGARTGLDANPGADGGPGQPPGVDAGLRVSFAPDCARPDRDFILFDLAETTRSLYALRADGSDGQVVTLPHAPALYPSISPDGSMLLYATFTSDGGDDSALYAYDLTTHAEHRIVGTTGLTYSALSPDGRSVAYVSSYSLRAVRADGSGDHALLDGPDPNGTGYGHPVFAGDSVTIVYGEGDTLGSIHWDGSANRVLFSESVGFHYPNAAFSGDHARLVAGTLCDSTAPWALRTYDYAKLPAPCSSGAVLAAVNESTSHNLANDPSWNPAGPIAYASGQDVFVIDPSGGTPANMTASLTSSNKSASDPVWVPACAVLP